MVVSIRNRLCAFLAEVADVLTTLSAVLWVMEHLLN